MSSPLIIAHRGASAVAPENTLAAFERAIRDGAEGIEFDVRLARDGVAVVIHDATLERTGLVPGKVAELSSEELQKTDVGTWFGRQQRNSPHDVSNDFSNERIPSLRQVFDLYSNNDGLLYLEMKGETRDGAGLVTAVVRTIRDYSLLERVIVECFDLSLIRAVKAIDPAIRTAALFEPKLSRPVSFVRRKLAELAKAHGAEEIALHYTLASPRAIENAKRLGLGVVVWTVDNPEWLSKARSLGVVALITNNPAVMLHARRALVPV
jgi:glycerophosphoryl diester phosphodiesterase